MLGWTVIVYRRSSRAKDGEIARWTTSVFGLKWLKKLVKEEKAIFLAANAGYPVQYSIAAGILLPILNTELPANDSPAVIGEDYYLPENWSGKITWHPENMNGCQPDETLFIDAWDQS